MRPAATRWRSPSAPPEGGDRTGAPGGRTVWPPERTISERLKQNPQLIGFAMAPAALAVLLVLREFGLVARGSLWGYVAVLTVIPVVAYSVDGISETKPERFAAHLRTASHVASVTVVIYMSGWGSEIVAAYGFVLVDNLSRSYSKVWKIVSLWTVVGVAAGQAAVTTGVAPTFIPVEKSDGLALLGVVVLLFIARMLGATAEQKEVAEVALRESEERFRSLVQHSYDTMIVTDDTGVVTFASPGVTSLIGFSPEQLNGILPSSLVHPDDLERVSAQVALGLGGAQTAEPVVFRIARSDGSWRHVEAVVSDLRDRPSIGGYVTNLRDVTERKEAEQLLEHQALHDPLTGLPNRALLGDRIQQAILRGRRADSPGPVVMFLDLDRFKIVNDSAGHTAGDKVLIEVADRLRGITRAADTLARFGGDEFVMLCENVADREALFIIADRVIEALDPPFVVDGKEFHVGASIGAAVVEGDTVDADELLNDADSAMYLAKTKTGRGRVQIFDSATRAQARYRVHTEEELTRALKEDELVVYYQPIVDLWTRRRVGVEALVRWQHPERGVLLPAEFLDVAERTGLIVPLGSWVLRTACAQVRAWNDELSSDHQLALSVNLSARQLSEPDLVDEVTSVLVDAGISPRALRLVLDLTDRLLPTSDDDARTHVRQLHRMGVGLAIDDFGTGYSSLQYMRELPISVVKIDSSFVRAIGQSARDEAIFRSVVDLAHTLGLTVTAEGVENEMQLSFVSEVGCDLAQGFLFGHPEPAEKVDIHRRSIQTADARLPSPA